VKHLAKLSAVRVEEGGRVIFIHQLLSILIDNNIFFIVLVVAFPVPRARLA